jgi:hypothetical protein
VIVGYNPGNPELSKCTGRLAYEAALDLLGCRTPMTSTTNWLLVHAHLVLLRLRPLPCLSILQPRQSVTIRAFIKEIGGKNALNELRESESQDSRCFDIDDMMK